MSAGKFKLLDFNFFCMLYLAKFLLVGCFNTVQRNAFASEAVSVR